MRAVAEVTRARATAVNAALAPYLAYLHARVLVPAGRKEAAVATLDTLSRSPRFPPVDLARFRSPWCGRRRDA